MIGDRYPNMLDHTGSFYFCQCSHTAGDQSFDAGRSFPGRAEYAFSHSSFSLFPIGIFGINRPAFSMLRQRKPGKSAHKCLIHYILLLLFFICPNVLLQQAIRGKSHAAPAGTSMPLKKSPPAAGDNLFFSTIQAYLPSL